MGKDFKGNSGISIELILQKIKREIKHLSYPTTALDRNIKKPKSMGKLSSMDWNNILRGIQVIRRITGKRFSGEYKKLLYPEQDKEKCKVELVQYRGLMERLIQRLEDEAMEQTYINGKIERLPVYAEIAQAARDGVLLKQVTRTENVDGVSKEITYDTTMSQREVLGYLYDYERQSFRIQQDNMQNYLGLGLGVAGIVGTIAKDSKSSRKDKGIGAAVTIATVAVGGLKLIRGILSDKNRDREVELLRESRRKRDELIENEQVSSKAQDSSIKQISSLVKKEEQASRRAMNSDLVFDVSMELANIIVSGMYINKFATKKENGKIDGKSLAATLVSLEGIKNISFNFLQAAEGIQRNINREKEFREVCAKVKSILDQMDEKVYPLKGANHPFDSFKIKDFKGNFYPKTDYETGETVFSKTIEIQDFNMKRGDIVLLSGDSGSGKSTFLRLLKRGDINNRNPIELDNGERVDHLGNEYISFRPSINLGDESTVLSQITGKNRLSDLTPKEGQNLRQILHELHIDNPLQQLASRKFMEFSTGQQRRLALSKLFYRIGDGTSIIIIDEPVGNVEDRLIREQLKLIKAYAEKRNVMTILVTHRLDLAEDLVNRRYHIDNQGVMREIPLQKEVQLEHD